MARRMAAVVGAGLLGWFGLAGAALAGPPPSTCQAGGGTGCQFASDLLVFAEGDQQYEIAARITECHLCTAPNAAGVFQFDGEVEVVFGPYDPQILGCSAADGTVLLTSFVAPLRPGAGGGGAGGNEATYIPANLSQAFNFQATPPLTPACVDDGNLEYRFQDLELTGDKGLKSLTSWLVPPESVRASFGGVPAQIIALSPVFLQQTLDFMSAEDMPSSSSLRLWAEGLPFRLGPDVITCTADQVQFTTPGGATAPPPYTPHPLPSAAETGLSAAQIMQCTGSQPEPANTCTTPHIRNAGYLDNAAWMPTNGQFDRDGLTVTLALPAGGQVLYQTAFPQSAWVKLIGPATVQIQDSVIASGSFLGGTTWLDIDRDPCLGARRLRYSLLQDPMLKPAIGAGGGLMAGIGNLHELDVSLQPQEILWSYNEASGLGCGTLWVPPPQAAAATPQASWLASAVPAIHGRGVYAGLNYNRNRVCKVGTAPTDRFCALDADCNPGERCEDAGFSPHCPALGPTPIAQWHTAIQDEPLQFAIDPDAAGQADREMAFFGRKSGITGVFDAGDNMFAIGDPNDNPPSFRFEFQTFGLAFLGSQSERADTIVQGSLLVPWPTDETFPFEEMEMCNCGAVARARTPDVVFEKTLAWWEASFTPYALNFKATAQDDCNLAQCLNSTQSDAVCVEALTPIPHFDPDPTSVFDLTPDGNVPTGIVPLSVSRMEFSRYEEGEILHDPYLYDIEKFVLQDWIAAGSPGRTVVSSGGADYGYYDAVGDLSLPFFGLNPAGIHIERRRQPFPADFLVDMHRECDPDVNPGCDPEDPSASFFEVERRMAGDSVLLHYKADYIRPSETDDPYDGSDGAFRGRGPVMAFSFDPHNTTPSAEEKSTVNLGSVSAATSLILTPDMGPTYPGVVIGGDLGPGAVVRLYDAIDPLKSGALESIMPPSYLTPGARATYEQALAALGYGGDWYETVKPAEFRPAIEASGAIGILAGHPAATASYNVDPNGASPPMSATELAGALSFSTDFEVLDLVEIGSNLDTDGQFFRMEGALQTIDRHVKEDEEPISQFTREILPTASNTMQLPGEQDIAFPNVPGMTWDFDYDVVTTPVPSFTFRSLTGTLDLTKGGLSGVGFDRMGATLKFYDDGDWYFDAGLKLDWNGYGINGDILLGNTKDMDALEDMDPTVHGFLKEIPRFRGVFARCGMSVKMFDYGCLFEVGAGVQVGAWFLEDSFGGKVRGYLTGQGACLVSVRGDLTLLGGEVNDAFKIEGHLWVAGGIGFCDEEDWDTPADVLDDDFCAACVLGGKAHGRYPPGRIGFSGPDVDCSL